MMHSFVYVALLLALLLCVFCAGRLSGRREGYRKAQSEIPIRLRAQLQLEQRCPICDDKQEYPFLKSQNQR